MAAKTLPKRHHTVPEFYLRGFCLSDPKKPQDPPMLWVYRRGQAVPNQQSSVNTAVRSQFNTFTDSSGKPNAEVEVILGQLEGLAAPFLRELTVSPDSLTAEGRQTLAVFLAVMGTRTPKLRRFATEAVTKTFEEHLDKFFADDERFLPSLEKYNEERGKNIQPEAMRNAVLGRRVKLTLTKPGQMAYSLGATQFLVEWLERMPWALLKAARGTAFVTSDNPLVIVAGPEVADEPGDELPTKFVEATFPLDPQHCLLIKPDGPVGPRAAPKWYVEEVVRRTVLEADKEVYCARKHPIVARHLT